MTEGLRAQIADMIVNLRQGRQATHAGKRYSQGAVARHVGVSQQRYSDYESGKCDIPQRRLRRIYHYLGGNWGEIVALIATLEVEDEEDEALCVTAS